MHDYIDGAARCQRDSRFINLRLKDAGAAGMPPVRVRGPFHSVQRPVLDAPIVEQSRPCAQDWALYRNGNEPTPRTRTAWRRSLRTRRGERQEKPHPDRGATFTPGAGASTLPTIAGVLWQLGGVNCASSFVLREGNFPKMEIKIERTVLVRNLRFASLKSLARFTPTLQFATLTGAGRLPVRERVFRAKRLGVSHASGSFLREGNFPSSKRITASNSASSEDGTCVPILEGETCVSHSKSGCAFEQRGDVAFEGLDIIAIDTVPVMTVSA
jgi:hypothetical protein